MQKELGAAATTPAKLAGKGDVAPGAQHLPGTEEQENAVRIGVIRVKRKYLRRRALHHRAAASLVSG